MECLGFAFGLLGLTDIDGVGFAIRMIDYGQLLLLSETFRSFHWFVEGCAPGKLGPFEFLNLSINFSNSCFIAVMFGFLAACVKLCTLNRVEFSSKDTRALELDLKLFLCESVVNEFVDGFNFLDQKRSGR